MTYGQQITATLIGTSAGFCGSVILFWLKELWQGSRRKRAIIKNLDYEFDYNINLLNKYDKDLTTCLEKIAADSKVVYCSIQYSKIFKYFANQLYTEGLFSKYLHPEDMKRWNDFLTTLSAGSENYFLEMLDKWRKSETTKTDVHAAVEQERTNIRYAREITEYLKGKIIG